MNDIMQWLPKILEDGVWAAVAAVGFAIMFNAPRRSLLACAIVGALGHALRFFLLEALDFSIVPATLTAAVVIGFLAKELARRHELPSLIYSIVGAIPMVPGAYAFRTMIGLLQLAGGLVTIDNSFNLSYLMARTLQNGILTALILGALAVGITAPTLLFERHKPVV